MTKRSICRACFFASLIFSMVVPALAQDADSAATLEKILALPVVTGERVEPVDGFVAYGGTWRVSDDGIVSEVPDSGARRT